MHTFKEKQASLNFYYALDLFYVWWANGGKQENLNLFRKHFLLTKLSFFDESKEILFFWLGSLLIWWSRNQRLYFNWWNVYRILSIVFIVVYKFVILNKDKVFYKLVIMVNQFSLFDKQSNQLITFEVFFEWDIHLKSTQLKNASIIKMTLKRPIKRKYS